MTVGVYVIVFLRKDGVARLLVVMDSNTEFERAWQTFQRLLAKERPYELQLWRRGKVQKSWRLTDEAVAP